MNHDIDLTKDDNLRKAAQLYRQGKKHALQDESVDGISCMLKAIGILEPMKGHDHRVLRGECCYFIGMMEVWRGRYGTAHDMLDEATKLNPDSAIYWAFLAQALMNLGADTKAKECALKAEDVNNGNNVVCSILQSLYEKYGDPEKAEFFRKQAHSFSYDNPDACFLMGNSDYVKKDKDSAFKWYARALELDPEHVDANYAYGLILSERRQFREAIPHFSKGVDSKCSGHASLWGRAMAYLTLGEYEQGWKDHEVRFVFLKHEYGNELGAKRLDKSQWSMGSKGRVHAYSEQGFGDCIQFCRYVKLLDDCAVTFEVDGSMVELMQHNFPAINIVSLAKDFPGTEGIPEVDFRIPLGSMMHAFNTTLETIPFPEGYLSAPQDKVLKFKHIQETEGLKIGLCWAGGKRVQDKNLVAMDEKRSIDFETIKPLLDVPGCSFFSLQTGLAARQTEDLIANPMADAKTWADTAGIIANLDIVISVDTSVLHMAAAMGKPTILLNKYHTCWRWLTDREDSPWYKSVQIIRPSKEDAWDEVIAKAKGVLLAWPR